MPAHRAPGRPGAGKGLGDKLLRRVLITDTDQDGEQAFILGTAVELREVRSLGTHAYTTRNRCALVTWLGCVHGRIVNRSCRDQYLTCDTVGGLERVRVADLGVFGLWVADLRTNTGSESGWGRRRRCGGSAFADPAVGLGGWPGVAILL